MKLMKTKTQSLFKISQELQVSKVDIKNSVQTFRKDKKNLEDPGVFLSPKEKKKWNKLSPRKKAVYYKKAKKQMKSPYAFSVEQETVRNTRYTAEQGEKIQTATKQLGSITNKVPSAVRAATKAAKRTAEFFQENLQRDKITHERQIENAKKNVFAEKFRR